MTLFQVIEVGRRRNFGGDEAVVMAFVDAVTRVTVSPGIDPGFLPSFPVPKNIVKYSVMPICQKICSSAPGLPDDPS